MNFRDLELKFNYTSEDGDLLESFYVPVLSSAMKYDRLSGFFSSNSLAIAARGIYEFLRNDGFMRLIVGSTLSQRDVDAIIEGERKRSEIIINQWVNELESISDEMIRDHVRALAWLVSRGKLEIRVAFVLDDNGNPIAGDASGAIFHVKVGIFTDEYGNRLSFSGSINETAAGWKRNFEEFKVFRDWTNNDLIRVEEDIARFEKLWSGDSKYVLVEPVPQAVEKQLLSIAPNHIDELSSLKKSIKLNLRTYQSDAVESWVANDYKGILAMATGTGKTITALGCMQKLKSNNSPLAIVISVPTIHLINQWKKTLELHGFQIVTTMGNSSKWKHEIANSLMDLEMRILDCLVILVTDSTFYRESFTSLFENHDLPIMFVGDEAHGLGSSKRMDGLLSNYEFRLGLTATPKRHFDDEGTKAVFDYFDGVVFEFDISKAIDSGYLCPYKYFVSIVGLNKKEMGKYKELTKKVAQAYYASKNDQERRAAFEHYSIQRRKIIVNAESKYLMFDTIIQNIVDLKHTLVYCSPQQIDRVQDRLASNIPGIIQSRFTARETPELRQKLLQSFESGIHEVLVAMRCLDEGVDLPATKNAIFLASTTNPRQFIQRRGRILRPHKTKNNAVVYDILVIPSSKKDTNYFELEKSIVRSELQRCFEFAKHSLNSDESLKVIRDYAYHYDIDIGDLT